MKNRPLTYKIELKPARGFEKIITNYTYMVFIEQLRGLLSALGLRYKITEDSRFVNQSEDWRK